MRQPNLLSLHDRVFELLVLLGLWPHSRRRQFSFSGVPKYRDLEKAWNTLDIIFNRRLYLAPLDNLNDPMELKTEQAKDIIESHLSDSGIDYARLLKDSEISFAKDLAQKGLLSEESVNANIRDYTLDLSTRSYGRVCSLSADPRNITMWSHYANGHKGVCLEFDLVSAKPIMYMNAERFQKVFSASHMSRLLRRIDNKETVKKMAYLIEKLRRLYAIKSSDWAYENEWRIWREEKHYNLKGSECLSRILVGSRISSFHYDILFQLVPSNVPIVRTELIAGEVREVS